MTDDPLIFVQVALVNGISENVLDLLDINSAVGDPEKADTAIFYSISNCHLGLAGVSFGSFLIKRVVEDLAAKLPNLKTFSTLSPIPGFLKWAHSIEESKNLSSEEKDAVSFFAKNKGKTPPVELKNVLVKLCAKYLLQAKQGEEACDRVAHFHLSNGARLERINWEGDLSPSGISQSAGIMVNYIYDLTSIESNHERYADQGEIVVSPLIEKLLES